MRRATREEGMKVMPATPPSRRLRASAIDAAVAALSCCRAATAGYDGRHAAPPDAAAISCLTP